MVFFRWRSAQELLYFLQVSWMLYLYFRGWLDLYRQQNSTKPNSRRGKFGLKTGTGILRRHLYETHLDVWVAGCDKLGISITAKDAQSSVAEYRARQNSNNVNVARDDSSPCRAFSNKAFVDDFVDFIMREDLVSISYYSLWLVDWRLRLKSLNIIESSALCALFLMLQSELWDKDIPHRTTIRKWIMEIFNDHFDQLAEAMRVRGLCILLVNESYWCIVAGVTWENLIHNWRMVQSKYDPIHGGDGSLDPSFSVHEWIKQPHALGWPYWVSLHSRTSWWSTPSCCFSTRPWLTGHSHKGMWRVCWHVPSFSRM